MFIFTAMSAILVTGASGNLGSAVVNRFSASGWKVTAVVSPRSEAGVMPSLKNAEWLKTEATSEAEVLKTIENILARGVKLDAAVLTIGGFAAGKFSETQASHIHQMLQLNFFTAWNFAKPLFEHMIAKKSGHLVLIGSQAGINLTEGAYAIGYSIAKTAVAKLAALLNETGKPHNVFCSLISPSTLDTPQNRISMPDADFTLWQKPESVAEEIFKTINR